MSGRNPDLKIDTDGDGGPLGSGRSDVDLHTEEINRILREMSAIGTTGTSPLHDEEIVPAAASVVSGVTSTGSYQMVEGGAVGPSPGGTASGKLVLITEESLTGRCCGRIGTGNKCCWRTQEECTYVSHDKNRATEDLKPGFWHVSGTGIDLR